MNTLKLNILAFVGKANKQVLPIDHHPAWCIAVALVHEGIPMTK
jgi:hypothetical protein